MCFKESFYVISSNNSFDVFQIHPSWVFFIMKLFCQMCFLLTHLFSRYHSHILQSGFKFSNDMMYESYVIIMECIYYLLFVQIIKHRHQTVLYALQNMACIVWRIAGQVPSLLFTKKDCIFVALKPVHHQVWQSTLVSTRYILSVRSIFQSMSSPNRTHISPGNKTNLVANDPGKERGKEIIKATYLLLKGLL